jgi:hypothetical protein
MHTAETYKSNPHFSFHSILTTFVSFLDALVFRAFLTLERPHFPCELTPSHSKQPTDNHPFHMQTYQFRAHLPPLTLTR